MTHEQASELLTQYLLGDLEQAKTAEIKSHLETCAACRAAALEIEPTLGLLRDALAAPSDAPEHLDVDRHVKIIARSTNRKLKVLHWFTIGHPRLTRAAVYLVAFSFLWVLSGEIMWRYACRDMFKDFGRALPAISTSPLGGPLRSFAPMFKMGEVVGGGGSPKIIGSLSGGEAEDRLTGGNYLEKAPSAPPASGVTITSSRDDSYNKNGGVAAGLDMSAGQTMNGATYGAPTAAKPAPKFGYDGTFPSKQAGAAQSAPGGARKSPAAADKKKAVEKHTRRESLDVVRPTEHQFAGGPESRADKLELAHAEKDMELAAASESLITPGPIQAEFSSNPDASSADTGAGVAGDMDQPLVPSLVPYAPVTKSPVVLKGEYGNRAKADRDNALKAYGGGGGQPTTTESVESKSGTALTEQKNQLITAQVFYDAEHSVAKPSGDAGRLTKETGSLVGGKDIAASQMNRMRAEDEKGLNTPRPLSEKEDRQLVAEGVLPPMETVAQQPADQAEASEVGMVNGETVIVKFPEEMGIPEAKVSKENAANENLISITLDDVELSDVVRMFTRISGANIIAVPSNLNGRVSVNLTDVDWEPTLKTILSLHNLKIVERVPGSGVYTIVSATNEPAAEQILDESAKKDEKETPVSISLDDVELADVVRMLTRISGANIITVPSNLVGRVSVNVENVGWKTVLRSVLSKTNLLLVEKIPGSGVYVIIPNPDVPKEEEKEPSTSRFKASGVNPFIETMKNAFSTFAIDCDAASYTLMRNYMSKGYLPPAESVRTEEFVNFFDYAYTPPTHETFRIYVDAAPSRFGHGLNMLKIGVKGRRLGREEQRRAVLTFLVDTSGSMNKPDRIGLVKKSLKMLVEKMNPQDQIAIIQFDSHARLVLELTAVSDKQKILAAIDAMQCGGSTNMEEGMKRAYEIAAKNFAPGGENRVLIMSDGVANLGTMEAEDILKSVEAYRKQGIFCSVFGLGIGTYNDEMLQQLANKGDGAYTFIDSEEEARRVLVDDLSATLNTIAKDVKIQVEFNPATVKRYRQLGYENRQLKKEDFRNDAVDAGEVGSGQSVTALYELEVRGQKSEVRNQKSEVGDQVATVGDQPLAIGYQKPMPASTIGIVRVRYKRTDNGKIEEIEQPILASNILPRFDDADARFRLAACAAEFSEILRGSPFAEGSDFDDVANALRPAALELGLDTHVQEFLRLVQSAKGMPRGE